MTRKQRDRIDRAINHLNRALAYVEGPEVAVCRRSHHLQPIGATCPADGYVNCGGHTLYEVERAYGSDLTGLRMGIDELAKLLLDEDAKAGSKLAAETLSKMGEPDPRD
jgi:hypothetical protein